MFSSYSSLDSVAHIIQVALTPVFLLSGIASLLNVFATRLGRVSDRVHQLSAAIKAADADKEALAAQLTVLRARALTLDVAVALAALGGAATCAATLTLLVGALRNSTGASVLFALFGVAVVSTLSALAAFLVEMLMAGRSLRAQARKSEGTARKLWPHHPPS